MTPRMREGFSGLQQIAVLLVVALVLTYGVLSLVDSQETHDAETVEAVQVTLQATVSKGMAALHVPPTQIHPMNLINAARTQFPKGVHVDKGMRMVIKRSGRGAQFTMTPEGDLLIISLMNFTRYHVENGRIVRSNRWGIPLPPF